MNEKTFLDHNMSYFESRGAFHDASSQETKSRDEDTADGALTPRSAEILLALAARPHALPELRSGLKLSSARLSFLLRRLKLHGLITVEIDGLDRRIHMAAITDSGQDYLARHRNDTRISSRALGAAIGRRKAEGAARPDERGCIDLGEEMLRFVVDAYSHFAEYSRPEVGLALIQALTILQIAERRGGAACVAETSDRLRTEMRRISVSGVPQAESCAA